MDLTEVERIFNENLVPKVSQESYEKQWDHFWSFLVEIDHAEEVTDIKVKAYILKLEESDIKPTTLRTKSSMLKK